MVLRHVGLSLCLAVSLIACNGGGRPSSQERSDFCRYARYFDVIDSGDSVAAVTFSPFDGSSDTLMLRKKAGKIVCMSSSYVACLSAIGCESTVVAVSGAGYISDPMIRQRWLRTAAGDPSDLPVYDIGYESTLDVERIVALRPDIVAVYTVSAAESKYVRQMKDLGLPVIVLYDHYEHEPLARAEYMRLLAEAYDTQDKKEFYEFTLALDALKSSLTGDEKTVILDANSELARILMGAG